MLGLVHYCDIKRSVAVGTNGRTQMQTLYKDVSCLVLPLNTTTTMQNEFELGKGYEANFDDDVDIRTADQIIWNGQTYAVRTIEPFIGIPIVAHIRALCELKVS